MIEKKIGVNFRDTGAEVKVWAPMAKDLQIKIINKNIEIALKQSEFGYWELQTNSIEPDDTYKINIDGKEFPDPASACQPEGVHSFSKAIDLKNFPWSDNDLISIPLDRYIIYELHTGTFSQEGTFEGIINKLDHLVELGINAIEIMPVAQFPGSRNWGYDGVFPFAVQESYGGPQGLQKLVNACHQKGVAVILDVVYNHFGPEGNYLPAFGPYFTEKYHTPWGSAINFDDEYCDGVRDYFVENVLMWFRDFHIDALRLDAVHAIKDLSAKHILQQIRQEVDKYIKQSGRKHYLIIECDLNDRRFLDPMNLNGLGMDAQWIDEFHHALRVSAGGGRNGYYSDFNGIEDLAKAYEKAFVYDHKYSPHRKRIFGSNSNGLEGSKFIVFSQNHDQVGNRMLGERSSELFSFEMQKLMAAATLVSPFLPMLFMGEEWAEKNPFLYFVSHGDEDLIAAVRKGRKEEFAAFQSNEETPDPQSEETFLRSKLNWNLLKESPHSIMFNYYKALIALRKTNPIILYPDRNSVKAIADKENQTLILYRENDTYQLVCLMNFSSQDQKLEMSHKSKKWKMIFNSAATKWGGNVENNVSFAPIISLPPESVYIYQTL